MPFIISRSFIAFWVEFKPRPWKISLILVVTCTTLAKRGHSRNDVGLWEQLGTHSHMESLARERLGLYRREKVSCIRD